MLRSLRVIELAAMFADIFVLIDAMIVFLISFSPQKLAPAYDIQLTIYLRLLCPCGSALLLRHTLGCFFKQGDINNSAKSRVALRRQRLELLNSSLPCLAVSERIRQRLGC
jgi:hypothetical protein